jgi:glycerol dehydrogenase
VQGPGALEALGPLLAEHGTHPLVIGDAFVLDLLGERVRTLLSDHGLSASYRVLTGEITATTADELAAPGADVDTATVDVVVGLGGGKSLDAAKAVALRLDRPVVTVPTIASNDSPTSAAVAMYDDRHVMVGVDRLRVNPAAVVVDTELVVAAPVAFLRAGVGDAIAKRYEARGCLDGSGLTPLGTRPLLTGVAIADACFATIRRHAVAGLRDCEAGRVTPDVEALVEAVVLMSGLGFENGGLSLAHSLTRGLMPARGASAALHGQHVAWALLVQREAEGADEEELGELTGFLADVGLATRLADLGLVDATAEEIEEIARLTMAAPHLANLARAVSHDDVVAAVQRVEARAQSATSTTASTATTP